MFFFIVTLSSAALHLQPFHPCTNRKHWMVFSTLLPSNLLRIVSIALPYLLFSRLVFKYFTCYSHIIIQSPGLLRSVPLPWLCSKLSTSFLDSWLLTQNTMLWGKLAESNHLPCSWWSTSIRCAKLRISPNSSKEGETKELDSGKFLRNQLISLFVFKQ